MEPTILTLTMTFKNQEGNNTAVSVKYVREDLTAEEVEAAMDLIITNDIFSSTGGSLISKVKAQVIAKSVQEFDYSKNN